MNTTQVTVQEKNEVIGQRPTPRSYELFITGEQYRAIQKFMDADLGNYSGNSDVCISWNYLMPVVEKIAKVTPRGYFFWLDYKIEITRHLDRSGIICMESILSGTTAIEAVHEAVYQFILWHEKQKEKTV